MGPVGRSAAWLEAGPERQDEAAAPPGTPALPQDLQAVLAVQRSAGNAATTAMIARAAAPVRLLQRELDEDKIKQRAHELWVRKGSPVQSREQEEADYFEAQRQLRIEERAHSNWQSKPGGGKEQSEEERTADYYEAERQLAAEAAAAAPSVEKAEQEAEIPKDPGAVTEPELVEATEAIEPKEPTEPVVAQPTAAQPKYVPPVRRGVAPIAPVAAPAPAALPPGWLADGQLRRLGFTKSQGRWQKNLRGWYGFDIHISVNPKDNAFDEFHLKFDLPRTTHRVYYFYDVTGKTNWDKSTRPGAAKAALKERGASFDELDDALKEMDSVARTEADDLVSRLR